MQHQPITWDAIKAAAAVRKELNPGTRSYNMGVKHTLPAESLGVIWTAIERRCNEFEHNGRHPFQSPILIAYHHGTKMSYKAGSRGDAVARYCLDLRAMFRLEHVRLSTSYVDIGAEDYPSSGQAVTLLWRAACIESMRSQVQAWAQQHGPAAQAVSWDQYLWMLSQDAGSVQYTVSPKSGLFCAGLAHAKVYNSADRVLFSSPLRGYGLFSNPALQRLGLREKRHMHQDAAHQHLTYEQLVNAIMLAANRMEITNDASRETSYGARQEARVRLDLVLALPEQVPATSPQRVVLAAGEHRSYWILPTADVSAFRRRAVERWVWPVYAAAARALQPAGLDMGEQERNCGTVICCLAVLRYMFAGQVRHDSAVWKDRLKPLRRKEDESDDELDDRSDDDETPHGMDLETAVAAYGTAWLPATKFSIATTPPTLKPEVFRHCSLIQRSGHLAYTQLPRRHAKAAQQTKSDWRLVLLRQAIRAEYSLAKCCTLAVQICIRELVRDVFFEVYKRRRYTDKTASGAAMAERQQVDFEAYLAERLDPDQRSGAWGLDIATLYPLSGLTAADVSRLKPHSKGFTQMVPPNASWEERLAQYLAMDLTSDARWDAGWKVPTWVGKRQFDGTLRSVMAVLRAEVPLRRDVAPDERRKWAARNAFRRAVARQAATSLWVVVASNTEEWSPTKRTSSDLPTYKKMCFASIDWGPRALSSDPKTRSQQCRQLVKDRQTRAVVSGRGCQILRGPGKADCAHYGWRIMKYVKRMEEVLDQWHDDEQEDREGEEDESEEDRIAGYLRAIFD